MSDEYQKWFKKKKKLSVKGNDCRVARMTWLEVSTLSDTGSDTETACLRQTTNRSVVLADFV